MIILYNELNLLHRLNSKPHPERPQRISEVVNHLKKTQYSKLLFSHSQLREKLQIKDEQLNQITAHHITRTQGEKYFSFIQQMWCEGISKPEMFINLDTYYTKETFRAAFQAVKTSILAVDCSFTLNEKEFICLVRPPGHHSGLKKQPHGFSFFNNLAIAANFYIQKSKKKIVIIDWDIHHGQGTQNLFYNRNDVLYISLHRFDQASFFPHLKQSGCQFLGQKQGTGFNINIAWNLPHKAKQQKRNLTETLRDEEYIYCFQNIIQPILRQYKFQAIFVSCGFDCAQGDPIGDCQITKKGFKYMTKSLKLFDKAIFIVLEGGYNTDTLKWGVEAVIQGLYSEFNEQQVGEIQLKDLNEFAQHDIKVAIDQIKKFWKI